MIAIRKNPNFTQWFQVFSFGKLIDEFKEKAKAVNYAKELARENDQSHFSNEGIAEEA